MFTKVIERGVLTLRVVATLSSFFGHEPFIVAFSCPKLLDSSIQAAEPHTVGFATIRIWILRECSPAVTRATKKLILGEALL